MHLRLIDGKTSHTEILPEIIIDGDLSEPPNWFNPQQRIIWNTTLRAAPPGMLKQLDASLMITFVVAAALHAECSQQVTEQGAVVLSPVKNVPMQSPYLSIMNAQAATMIRCIAEMGFSPTARVRVKVPSAKARSSSTFANLKKLKLEEKRPR
jgi:P27 family predicted phage terminase small subunit